MPGGACRLQVSAHLRGTKRTGIWPTCVESLWLIWRDPLVAVVTIQGVEQEEEEEKKKQIQKLMLHLHNLQYTLFSDYVSTTWVNG